MKSDHDGHHLTLDSFENDRIVPLQWKVIGTVAASNTQTTDKSRLLHRTYG
ncbi:MULTISPECIES: hypothetical protein [unclassified Moorena]|uniref:hypothetical protein n=1 Tax=unclassified Moorena TaxID=2683338 RepID=UPI0013FF6026|nr:MULTISPECIES: hypothetical protein [unclassified Moorena]NEO15264.1 hypothetical protein [Moorena sp. SIO3E8]NEQ01599.1 hypothetical protein [Moorena sp. SIO3F7]